MTVTRLEGILPAGTVTPPLEPEAAWSIMVQLQDLRHHELRMEGRTTYSGEVPADAVSAVDLGDRPVSALSGHFDALQFHVPHRLMAELAEEDGFPRIRSMTWPRADRDPVAGTLGALLVPALIGPDPAKAMFIEQVSLAFLAHAATRYGRTSPRGPSGRSGLAPWQERRAKEIVRARYATALTVAEISRECRLSPSYFSAAFRRSTGRSPHAYLSGVRTTEAQRLMLTTSLPLADVALLCGFGDQSYFTRVFTKLVGASPGHWRRRHRDGAS